MNQSARDALARLSRLVQEAKGVPLSAGSCVVNRAEFLGLIGQAEAALAASVPAAAPEAPAPAPAPDPDPTADARADADRIVADARAEADRLVGQENVVAEARAEADALRREADTFVEQRIAALAEGLSDTLAELERLRARLAERAAAPSGGE